MDFVTCGEIEKGKFKGRRFLIPKEVWVEEGAFLNGAPSFRRACLKHEIFVPDSGCLECKKELKNK